jgi:hypothetical protein
VGDRADRTRHAALIPSRMNTTKYHKVSSFSLFDFVCMLYAFSYATVKEGWTVHGMAPLSTVVFACVTLVGFSVGRYGA